MIARDWLSRGSLGWLLAAQFALVSTHLGHLPVWVLALWLFAAGWRVLVFQGRVGFPPRWVKLIAIAGAVAGIWSSYGSWQGLEPMAALLVSGFCFKLMEAATRRDAYVLIFLGYFVALSAFLFGQELLAVLHVALAVGLLLTAQVALHQTDHAAFSRQALRLATMLLLQALPLALLLFLVTPRLAPMWRVPIPGEHARTGMSEVIAPGDVAKLARSAELVFRARFDQPAPPPADLYWRGLVLDHFDGRAWRPGPAAEWLRRSTASPAPPGIDYEIFLEPTGTRWLYALWPSMSRQSGIVETADGRLVSVQPVHDKFRYQVRLLSDSAATVVRDSGTLPPPQRRSALRLPADSNPRTRQWAAALRDSHPDDAQLIAAVLGHLRHEPFVYTLQPPTLGEHSIDEFLFQTRRGFCEHYASSFAFVLRAAGIPARVVAGYQGGEPNPLNGTLVVRQYDAHAWVEAWLPEYGWVRLDPTAAVAPERVEMGLEGALPGGEFLAEQPLSPNRYRHIPWLNRARMQLDSINYQWTRWVVDYRGQTQEAVLRRLLGEIDTWRLLLFAIAAGGVSLLLCAAMLFGRHWHQRQPPERRLFERFCRQMARRGYPRPAALAARNYGEWLQQQRPEWQFVRPVIDSFEALQYRPLTPVQRRLLLQRLRAGVRQAARAS
ncbi:MAG: DUF3488 and transglutaminase-like domain-containing protein [Spongiibacteraceae bacterium]|nr:DUF3488 and transglutaminase-like domain-containing protein [Spongiibacteraceae bacterium]